MKNFDDNKRFFSSYISAFFRMRDGPPETCTGCRFGKRAEPWILAEMDAWLILKQTRSRKEAHA